MEEQKRIGIAPHTIDDAFQTPIPSDLGLYGLGTHAKAELPGVNMGMGIVYMGNRERKGACISQTKKKVTACN